MKKHTIYSYILPLFLSIAFVSCDSYLEESPDDRLELNTLDKAAKVVADSYSVASFLFTETYTDLAGPTGNPDGNGIVQDTGGNIITNQDRQLYKWEEVNDIFQETPTYYWDRSYAAIAQTNEVLAIIDNLDGEQDKKNAIKGEALLSRAYHHFMLVNIFGLHYDQNAATNLGVPYITSPETEFLPSYTRNTVKEVYDLVEKDLLEGLSLINDKFFIGTKKYHFTKKAALAFASRFYLWKKDYANCKKYSDLFFDGSPATYIKDYTQITGANFQETANKHEDPADPSNLLVIQKFSFYTRVNQGFRLTNNQLSEVYQNQLGIDDIRDDLSGTIGSNGVYLPRVWQYTFRENLSSNTFQAYHIEVVLKGEEVLFNRAEANLFLGNQDAALSDINIIAENRYRGQTYTDIAAITSYYDATDETEGMLRLILDERKKEFWFHGLRWFDIKRHNIPVTHILPVSEGGETVELPANDPRRAVQIPRDAISFGLTPNPR
ncbi:RagB/SusD family nutrient uptake outer membrane protein [Aquimarina sp. TRL1]|uniref:RagB/SusD family nutrient uptake outer membrane protein n=1 Tax=Aquimarina sp. (strain TRL1) TaxID=2736252 RepID=UPI00158A1F4D|nr:RagB/SusD family nutrient uptake outer membrane protein [Aquimarina sp. TRL1]QKX06238.1 RagB/SusD family nutrient uptake outer membrane protein [Aquimarina sp. TRL1]